MRKKIYLLILCAFALSTTFGCGALDGTRNYLEKRSADRKQRAEDRQALQERLLSDMYTGMADIVYSQTQCITKEMHRLSEAAKATNILEINALAPVAHTSCPDDLAYTAVYNTALRYYRHPDLPVMSYPERKARFWANTCLEDIEKKAIKKYLDDIQGIIEQKKNELERYMREFEKKQNEIYS